MSNIKRTDKGRTHLVIPDSHAQPGYNNNRYDWLGKLIADVKPDVIINIGDHWDMPSLCSYDYGKKGFEGRRFKKDVAVGIEANDRVATAGRAAYRDAEKVFCYGNHEARINRVVESDAKMEGVIGLHSLQVEDYYDRSVGFLDAARIDGVNYSHYFTSGVMGRPIGGEHPAYQLISKKHESCTQGHSHMLDYCRRVGPKGHAVLGCAVGCYFDYHADYAGPANEMYWRGIVVKRNVCRGDYDPEFITLSNIRKAYR